MTAEAPAQLFDCRDAFADTLIELAHADPRVVAVVNDSLGSTKIAKLARDETLKPFEARAGVMDGERLSGKQVEEVSKWPSRTEQLSLLMGQILSPGATLVGQLSSVGGALASQIEQKSKGEEKSEEIANCKL